MPHNLPTIDHLVRTSWDMTQANWRQTLRYTLWPLIISLAFGVLSFVLPLIYKPLEQDLWFMIATAIPGWAASIWFGIRLTKYILKRDQGQQPTPEATCTSMTDVLHLIWIGLLIAIPTIIASLFFLLPGIWLGNILFFSFYLYLEDGKQSVSALTASKELVQGRWWATFWRRFVPALVAIAANIAAGLITIFSALIATGIVFAAGYGIHLMATNSIVTNILTGMAIVWICLLVVAMVIYQFAVSILMSLFNGFVGAQLFHASKHAPATPDVAPTQKAN